MFVLDTDHMSFLDRPDSAESVRVRQRMEQHQFEGVATTIVSYEEQLRGWLAYIARAKSISQLVTAYWRLEGNLTVYRSMPVLGFDEAAEVEFVALKGQRFRVGTIDLRIAAIAWSRRATLISRNVVDFVRIPSLTVEDWTRP